MGGIVGVALSSGDHHVWRSEVRSSLCSGSLVQKANGNSGHGGESESETPSRRVLRPFLELNHNSCWNPLNSSGSSLNFHSISHSQLSFTTSEDFEFFHKWRLLLWIWTNYVYRIRKVPLLSNCQSRKEHFRENTRKLSIASKEFIFPNMELE